MILAVVASAWAADLEPQQLVDWIAACQSSESVACLRLGVVYAQGSPPLVPVNLGEASRWLERACEGDSAEGCLGLGAVRETLARESATPDLADAAAAYSAGCSSDLTLACAALAALYERGEVDGDPIPLRASSCAEGHPESCVALGVHREGVKDPAGALAAYRLGCEANSVEACAALGAMLLLGPKATRDISEARAHLGTACTAGLGPTCGVLGDTAETPEDALTWWVRGCEHDDTWSCWRGYRALRKEEPDRAIQLATVACEQGFRRACRVVEREN